MPTAWLDAGEVVIHEGLDCVGDSDRADAKTGTEEIRLAYHAGLRLIGQIAKNQQWTYPLYDTDSNC